MELPISLVIILIMYGCVYVWDRKKQRDMEAKRRQHPTASIVPFKK